MSRRPPAAPPLTASQPPAPPSLPPSSMARARAWLRDLAATDRAAVAMACALLLAWALARAGLTGFAPEDVALWIMARTPPDLANTLLDRLGDVARPVALLGGLACYLGLSAATGALTTVLRNLDGPPARSAPWLALLTTGLIWGVAAGALDLPLLPNLLLLLFFALAWSLLAATLPAPAFAAGPGDRRGFLRGAAIGAGAVMLTANVVFVDALLRVLRGVRLGGEPLFAWSPPESRVQGFDLAGLLPEVTPVERFYRMSKNVHDPVIGAEDWSLRLHGLVREPLRLDYPALLDLPRTDLYATLRCVSNRVDGVLMSTALFSGVPLRLLLERAGLDPAARVVVFRSPDGHSDSVELARALLDETLIAYAMNGRTLTREHGFPARLLVPGLYGFKHVKWLTDVEVAAEPYTGTWQALGWTANAVKTMARIDVARTEGDTLLAAGVAYAGSRGISAVQVRLDDGPWQEATLHAPPLSGLTWLQWRATLPAGATSLTVRAIDAAGRPQEEAARGQFPDGAQGLHRVSL